MRIKNRSLGLLALVAATAIVGCAAEPGASATPAHKATYTRADIEGVVKVVKYIGADDHLLTQYIADGCWAVHVYSAREFAVPTSVQFYWVHENPTYGPQVWESEYFLGPGAYRMPTHHGTDDQSAYQKWQADYDIWELSAGDFPCDSNPEFVNSAQD
jgi:hypothetical protein